MSLTATDIFAKGIKRHKVRIESLDDDIYVQELSANQTTIFREVYANDPSFANITLIILSVVDKEGNRIFDEDSIDDLNKLTTNVITELTVACQKNCGIFTNVGDAAKN